MGRITVEFIVCRYPKIFECCRPPLAQTQEAKEVMADSGGKWFLFAPVMDTTLFVLDTKGLPDHLAKISVVDTPSTLEQVLLNLVDGGEVRECEGSSIWMERCFDGS